jgi:hypothetical protein
VTKFAEIGMTYESNFVCNSCGKRRSRSKKFYQTLNPFNRDKDGNPKTPEQIRCEVNMEADDWLKKTKTCRTCEAS